MKGLGPPARALLSRGDVWPLTVCGHKGLGCALCSEAVRLAEKRACDSHLCPWGLLASSLGWNPPPLSQIWMGISHPSFLWLTAWKKPRAQLPPSGVGLQGLETPPGWKLCRRVGHPRAAGRFRVRLSARAKGEACVISPGMGMGREWRSCAGELTCDCAGSARPVSPRWWLGMLVTTQLCRSLWNVIFAGKNLTGVYFFVCAKVGCPLNCLSAFWECSSSG